MREKDKDTISSLHRKKLLDIENDEHKIDGLNSSLLAIEEKLRNENNRELLLEKDRLKKEIERIKSAKINYLLKNGELLFLHSELERNRKNNIQGMQILKKKKEINLSDDKRYYRQYRSNIDTTYVYAPEHNINEDNYCFGCKQFKVVHQDEAISICEKCGYSTTIITSTEKPSMQDPPSENKQYEYKRYTHFCDWLSNLQGKENTKIPDDVINSIIREISREKMQNNVDELTEADIKRYLKKYSNLGYDRYYDHATQILFKITNIPPLQMSADMEHTLKLMFMEIQEPFELYKGKHKKNFSSYSYIIYKFCQLLDYKEFLPKLKLHKDKSKLYEHDRIWKQICNHLGGDAEGWTFIKS